MATSRIAMLSSFTIDELLSAIAVKGQYSAEATADDQAHIRADEAKQQARRAAYLAAWNAQTPTQWANQLAQAGMPRLAAQIMRDLLAVIFERQAALESRIAALESQPLRPGTKVPY